MTERRYNEEEVAAIFERATQAQASQPGAVVPLASSEGMTLGQLQEIGREIGISSAEIENAARGVARSGQATSQKVLGVTIGVGRTVELPRKITDEEWEHLVVDLRDTFDARGKVHAEGGLRQWTNGNLQALLEPTQQGHRLRLKTRKGDLSAFVTAGAVMVVLGLTELGAQQFAEAAVMMSAGAAIAGVGLLRLPSWLRARRRQMADIAARLAASTSAR